MQTERLYRVSSTAANNETRPIKSSNSVRLKITESAHSVIKGSKIESKKIPSKLDNCTEERFNKTIACQSKSWSEARRMSSEKTVTSLSKCDTKYPENLTSKLTDPKHFLCLMETIKSVQNPDDTDMSQAISQFMSKQLMASSTLCRETISANTKTRAASSSITSSVREETCTLQKLLHGGCLKGRVHKLRSQPKTIPKLSVPPHVIIKPRSPDTKRVTTQPKETLSTLLRNRYKRAHREAAAVVEATAKSVEMRLGMADSEQPEQLTRRQRLEMSLASQLEEAKMLWCTEKVFEARAKVKIIIVGAGLAGLSAAVELISQGFWDVTVLEASHRAGGRLHSVQFCDAASNSETSLVDDTNVVDDGTIVHQQSVQTCEAVPTSSKSSKLLFDATLQDTEESEDETNNNIKNTSSTPTPICKVGELGAPNYVLEDESDYTFNLAVSCGLVGTDHGHFKTPNFKVLTPTGFLRDDVVTAALRFCRNTEREAKILSTRTLLQSRGRGEPSSVAYSDLERNRCERLLGRVTPNLLEDMTTAIASVSCTWSNFAKQDGAADMADIQTCHEEPFIDITQTEDTFSPSLSFSNNRASIVSLTGRRKVVNRLPLAGCSASLCEAFTYWLPRGTVRYRHRLVHLDWTSFNNKNIRNGVTPKLELSCAGQKKKLLADHVIMAVPSGHLKKFASSIFSPRLSEKKIAALDRIGVAHAVKFVLYYRSPPWKEYFHFVWSGRKPGEPNYDPESFSSKKILVTTSPSSLNVLELSLNDHVDVDDAQVSAEITEILNLWNTSLQNKSYIPLPDYITRSSWNTDPLYLGSYPYLRRGVYQKDLSDLALPVTFRTRPVIQFAGDYTWSDYNRLLHGARASGLREARRLVDLYDEYFGYDNANVTSARNIPID